MGGRSIRLLTALLLVTIGVAGAGHATNGADVIRISGESPFADGCGNTLEYYRGGEVEPSIAVNPTNPQNIIATWQQDRFKVGMGALTDAVGVSMDGGATWTTVLVSGLTRCTGGPYDRATDPWVSIGADGTAYLAAMTIRDDSPYRTTGIVVARSTDGGFSWSEPVVVDDQDYFNDKESITAHPTVPSKAYMAWTKQVPYTFSLAGVICCQSNTAYLSKTVDGGATWSDPRPIFTAPFFVIPYDSEIFVLSDGTLLDVFQLYNPSDHNFPDELPRFPITIMSMRSENDGLTWSEPVVIGQTDKSGPRDPDRGVGYLNHPTSPSADIGPSGEVYVTWPDTYATDSSIMLARTTDGGRAWSAPVRAATVGAPAFTPTLAVSGEGTVGITFYDFRNDVRADAPLTTDVWFTSSTDGGVTWNQEHLAGPFDMRTAPSKGEGRFVGDYAGLAGLPHGFAAAFGMARPAATFGASDIFFAHVDH